MTGSVAIDVAIGLIFVFLLYSLLASVLLEFVATFLRLRARNLSFALGRLLTDNRFSLKGFFLGSWGRKGQPDLRDRLYDQPLLKRTARGVTGSKPSYIHAKNISESLLNVLKEAAGPEAIAARGTMNAINDKLTELANTTEKDSIVQEIDPKTAKMLAEMLRNTGYDLVQFQNRFEEWYDNSMERVIGWYKQWTQILLLIIGFCLAVAFNVDTIAISKKLAKDPEARAQMVHLAEAKVQAYEGYIATVDKDSTNDSTEAQPAGQATTTTTEHPSIEELNAVRDSIEKDMAASNEILGLGWGIVDEVLLIYSDSTSCRPTMGVPYADSLVSVEPDKIDPKLKLKPAELKFYAGLDTTAISKTRALVSPGLGARFRYGLSKAFSNGSTFVGLLLTALAISLGAPFWFDMLNKIVKVKSSISGTAESRKKEDTATKAPDTPTLPANPTSIPS